MLHKTNYKQMKKITKWFIAIFGIILIFSLAYRVWDRAHLKSELDEVIKKGNYYCVFNTGIFEYDSDNFSELYGVSGYKYEYPLKNEIWHIVQLRKNEKGDLHKYYIKPTKVISDVKIDSTKLYNCLEEALHSILSKDYIGLGERLGKPYSNDSIEYLIHESEKIANSYEGIEFWHVDEVQLWGSRDYFGSSIDIGNQRILVDGVCIDNRMMQYSYNASFLNVFTAIIILLFVMSCIWGLILYKGSYEKYTNKTKANSIIKQETKTIETKKTSPVIPQTYWNKYKLDNPTKAAEIELLGLDFSKLPDLEVKEKIFSLETTAIDSNCSISALKQKVFDLYEGKIEEGDYLSLVEYYDKRTYEEAKLYNIERTNTIWMIVSNWMLEKAEKIERKYASLPPRSKKDPMTLLMQFNLEDFNEFSILRKTHIYMKNYPMTTKNKEYVKLIEDIFDKYLDAYIKPIVDNKENKANVPLFNALVSSQAYMACEKVKEECEKLIKECNGHDVSFYAELDIAVDRAIAKYSIQV